MKKENEDLFLMAEKQIKKIELENINIKTMESKIVNDLYFAGEVLDIDGITGGYNFQSAWTTGFIAGKLGE